MVDGVIPAEVQNDERDPGRTPMQWNTDKHAGFSCAPTAWLPVNQNYREGINVEAELNQTGSHLYYYKSMMAIKKSDAVKNGVFETKVLDNVLVILRGTEKERYLIMLNLNDHSTVIDPVKAFNLPHTWTYAFSHKSGRNPG